MNADFFFNLNKFHLLGTIGTAEDFADKLNYRWSGAFLLMFVALIGLRSYVFAPIQCWVPKEWPSAWEQYAENLCWVENTYFIDGEMQARFPEAGAERHDREISYYQWVPFFFALQAAFFYGPHMLWTIVSSATGYDVNVLLKYAADANVLDPSKKEKLIHNLASQIVKSMRSRGETPVRQGIRRFTPNLTKKSGNFLVAMYLSKKVLYIVNCFAQFWFMKVCLGVDSYFFGWNIISMLAKGGTWMTTTHFPRVTFCDVPIRAIGQSYTRTIQCVLPINMLNEKLYIFLWFWVVLCLVVAIVSLVHWTLTLAVRSRKGFLDRYMKYLANTPATHDREAFINGFLERDGIFILQMIQRNVGDVMATEVLEETYKVWDEWRGQQDENMELESSKAHYV